MSYLKVAGDFSVRQNAKFFTKYKTIPRGTYIDESSYKQQILINDGNPSQGTMSKFSELVYNSGLPYNLSVDGGSVFCERSENLKLTDPIDYGTGDFTIEFWYKHSTTGLSGASIIFSQAVFGNNNLLLAVGSARQIGVWLNHTNLGTSATGRIPFNTWCHIALVRSATNVIVYIDGINRFAYGSPITGSIGGGMVPCINGYAHDSSYSGIGWYSNLRITKGMALYNSNFTPPTSLLTLTSNGGASPSTLPISSNVALLCNFTQGKFLDNICRNDVNVFGAADLDTTVKKFGKGSLSFISAANQHLNYAIATEKTTSDSFNLQSNINFTIECWVRFKELRSVWAVNDFSYIFSNSQCGLYTYAAAGPLNVKQPHYLYFDIHSSTIATSFSPALNTWYHIAVTRQSGVVDIWVDGVKVGTQTIPSTSSSTNYPLNIGTTPVAGSNTNIFFSGWIDDFRFTRGVARYPTESFPTAALPNTSSGDPYFINVSLLLQGT